MIEIGVEIVKPAHEVGARVVFKPYGVGTIAQVYAASCVPMWIGTRRVMYEACYHYRSDTGVNVYGVVDHELEAAQ